MTTTTPTRRAPIRRHYLAAIALWPVLVFAAFLAAVAVSRSMTGHQIGHAGWAIPAAAIIVLILGWAVRIVSHTPDAPRWARVLATVIIGAFLVGTAIVVALAFVEWVLQ